MTIIACLWFGGSLALCLYDLIEDIGLGAVTLINAAFWLFWPVVFIVAAVDSLRWRNR